MPRRAIGLLCCAVALIAAVLMSISIGSKAIPLADVWQAVRHPDGSENGLIVSDSRLPRTVLGLLAGACLGAAGTLMQAITRNPLADPGLLGVNAGASLAVVASISIFGAESIGNRIWFAFAGAALAATIVYGLGASGRAGASPVRLALAGMAVSAALVAAVQAIALLDPQVFDSYRFWVVGSLTGAGWEDVRPLAPVAAAALALALLLGRPLNALALGDDAGRALGVHAGRVRLATAVAITVLCGGATAVVGPIFFVGMAVPLAARAITGPDQRWLVAYSIVLAPALVLVCDVAGRVLESPDDIATGVICSFVGAPAFIWLVSRRRIAHL